MKRMEMKGLLSAIAVFAFGGAQAAQVTARPNILVIVADDHRQDLVGKYHDIIQTPTLDALCDQGIYFRNAYVTTPICAASRASIFTGLTERTHGYTFGEPTVPEVFSEKAYPRLLKENGYRTGFVGKYGCKLDGASSTRFHFYDSRSQRINETYDGQSIPQTYYIANKACDFIESSVADYPNAPWCMSVSFWNPHAHDSDLDDQYHYPPEFDSLYEEITLPDARISDDATFNALPQFIRESKSRERWGWRYEGEKFQRMTKRYYRAITGVDKAVQMMRDKLKDLQIDDNTVIIYIGDNGYMINERQLAGKWLGWEECLRVPLIIHDPRTNAVKGVELDQPALNIDLAPTIAELAGLPVPELYQGRSLYPLMTGEAPLWREEFFFEHYFSAGGTIPRNEGVRTENWKYVHFVLDDYEQLYDLQADPGELTNLAYRAVYSNRMAQLRHVAAAYAELYRTWPEPAPLEASGWTYVDNLDEAVVYGGAWNTQYDSNDFDGSMTWSSASGSDASLTFEGDAVRAGVRMGGSGGICNIYLDDLLLTNQVDTYSAERRYQVVIAEADLEFGTHTVRIEATGQKNPSSGAANIMFDFFAYHGAGTNYSYTDHDEDRLPDRWEVRYLDTLFRLPSDDDDGDGRSNGDEFVASTDPKDAASRFVIEQSGPEAGHYSLGWAGRPNRIYVVRKAAALSTNTVWTPVSPLLPGQGQHIEFSETTSMTNTQAFYDVEVRLPE